MSQAERLGDLRYYVRRQGQIDGPWPVEKLQSEVKLQKLGRHHEVSVDRETWSVAANVPGLFPKIEVRKTLRREGSTPQATAGYPVSASMTAATQVIDNGVLWYYSLNDQQEGPVDPSQIAAMLREGTLRLDSLVWAEGMSEWAPAESIPAILRILEGNTGSYGGETEATRLVKLPVRKPVLAYWAAGVGAGAFVLSCVPLLGLIGGLAVVLGGFAFREIGSQADAKKLQILAGMGIALGFVSVIFAFASPLVIWALW